MSKKRTYCPYCSGILTSKSEGDTIRDFCVQCNQFFYDNPLPVASTIIVKERRILLVKRKNDPHKGLWCLPMGFAESGESIEAAALRELEEETGVKGKVIGFINADSGVSSFYGDLLFLTFEAEQVGGRLSAGDDAIEVKYFSFDDLPKLPFSSNIKSIETYLRNKQEYWAIIDSFKLSLGKTDISSSTGDFLSDKLIRLIEKNAEIIANHWLEDVRTNKSTPAYKNFDPQKSFHRNKQILAQFGKWLGGHHKDTDIKKYYRKLGKERQNEGFALSEVISALSLTRKHIWQFALSQRVWTKAIDIYMYLELERRMMIFFDKATFYMAKGYEKGQSANIN
ncbi:MAG: NUDIX hydrolase [Bacteroidales bacterium]|nr:NUDIX hydrolase [Bacteroidales bacterium]